MRRSVGVQASNKSTANSPVKPSAPKGPARMVLAAPDGCHWKRAKRNGRESTELHVEIGSTEGPKDSSTPARGRLLVQTYKVKRTQVRTAVRFQRQYGESARLEYKPVLRDELGAVVTIHRYPPERLRKSKRETVLEKTERNVNDKTAMVGKG